MSVFTSLAGPMLLGVVHHTNQWGPGRIAETLALLSPDLARDGDGRAWVPHLPVIHNFGLPRDASGVTPHDDAGRAHFAGQVASFLAANPGVDAVEIGNEFNGANFVSGPVKTAGRAERPAYYDALVDAVRAEAPDAYLIGGATHSLAVGYLRDLGKLGHFDAVDGLAFHPYTTPPEQLGQHISILRAMLADFGAGDMDLHVTEFGTNAPPGDVAAYLVKAATVLAAEGVETAAFYASHEQSWFPGLIAGGALTLAGEAFGEMQALLARGRPVELHEDEPLVRAYQFGADGYVLWGHGTVARGDGERIALDPDTPVVRFGAGFDYLGTDVLVDTRFDFGEAGWDYGAGVWREGGERAGVPWRPYIDQGRGARLTEDMVTAGAVETWTAPKSATVDVATTGPAVAVTLNGAALASLDDVAVSAGDRFEFRWQATGDRRVTITEDAPAPTPAPPPSDGPLTVTLAEGETLTLRLPDVVPGWGPEDAPKLHRKYAVGAEIVGDDLILTGVEDTRVVVRGLTDDEGEPQTFRVDVDLA